MSKFYCSLGLMSGTSADGVDASIIQSDGDTEYKVILDKYFSYSQNIYKNIHNFKDKINNLKDSVHKKLQLLKDDGLKIVGFGASATVTTVISVLKLDRFIDYLVDDNKIKQGTFSPEYRLPVKPVSEVNNEINCCIIILPWRFSTMFIEKNSHHLERGGSFLNIIPSVTHIKN